MPLGTSSFESSPVIQRPMLGVRGAHAQAKSDFTRSILYGGTGHDQSNRACLDRLLPTDKSWERATYGMEYCALTFLEFHGLRLGGTLEAARWEHFV